MIHKLSEVYYINFDSDAHKIGKGQLGPVDENGIPMVNYNERYRTAGIRNKTNIPFGVHYTPVTVSIYAFSLLQGIVSGNSTTDVHQDKFFQLVDWLVRTISPISPKAGVWQHSFQIPFASGISPPYPSGIAQAQAISLLLRAYQLRADDRYIAVVHQAFNAFLVDIDNGGVRCVEGGFTWIEEWPSKPRSHVLNGFMFALLAIYDYKTFFGTDVGTELWTEGLRTLTHNIDLFDSGYGSRYDLLRGLVVSETYHQLHIKLLRELYLLSSESSLLGVAERWENYLLINNPFKRRALAFCENVVRNPEYRFCKFRQIISRISP